MRLHHVRKWDMIHQTIAALRSSLQGASTEWRPHLQESAGRSRRKQHGWPGKRREGQNLRDLWLHGIGLGFRANLVTDSLCDLIVVRQCIECIVHASDYGLSRSELRLRGSALPFLAREKACRSHLTMQGDVRHSPGISEMSVRCPVRNQNNAERSSHGCRP